MILTKHRATWSWGGLSTRRRVTLIVYALLISGYIASCLAFLD